MSFRQRRCGKAEREFGVVLCLEQEGVCSWSLKTTGFTGIVLTSQESSQRKLTHWASS